jgi:hypothetical protein
MSLPNDFLSLSNEAKKRFPEIKEVGWYIHKYIHTYIALSQLLIFGNLDVII